MNIKRAKEEIKNTIKAYLLKDEFGEYVIPSIRQRPVLLMGPPGIGKTQIMEQTARECHVGLVAYTITHHTRQSAVGLPFIKEKEYGGKACSVTEYTMSEIIAAIYDKMERTGIKEGILFIDEINCVSETMAPMMLQFLQCKTFGNQQVPEGWIIVAAGNPPEYNKSVRDFDVVTLDRVKRLDVEADYGVWKEYAYREKLQGAILSYLDIRKDHFYRIETTVDGVFFATARGWEDLSQFLSVYEELGQPVDAQVIGQYIQHPKIAKDFANYLELYHKYHRDYQIDEVLAGRVQPSVISKLHFAEFDERISVMGLLLDRLGEEFRKAYLQDRVVTELFGHLRSVRVRLDKMVADTGNPAETDRELRDTVRCLEEERQLAEKAFQRDREAGQLDKLSEITAFKVQDKLEYMKKYVMNAAEDTKTDTGFSLVREAFAEETQGRQELLDKTAEKLDYAFDFLEAAFGQGQELVVFVTELTAGYYSAWYIQENGCDRYYKYNKGLLFAERQQEISSQIEEAKDWMTGADLI
ncbi:AAA family ATPase [Lacrimispora sp. NSJ-141]|uniref:AAA family ATPase n=1 Tax=Lientehia hominis TaxID=2897778 RepID=A0AAP2WA85_9FIRM|nr:AAA family ATPase [Lientehia hominis]